MAITPVVMQPGLVLSNVAQVVYTTPTGVRAIIKRATFTNIDVSNRTITVYRVPALSTPTSSNIIISAQLLNPGQDYSPLALNGLVLNSGEMIYAMSDVSLVVNFFMSGFTSS